MSEVSTPYIRAPPPPPRPRAGANDDIFEAGVGSGSPVVPSRPHTVVPQGCSLDTPIQTNNFSNNLTLDDQLCPVWTLPYSMWLVRDRGAGLAVNHTLAQQRVFGPDAGSPTANFYFNPPRIQLVVLLGSGLTPQSPLTLDQHHKMSVRATLGAAGSSVLFPLVQGMGFVTAVYTNMAPVVQSPVGIRSMSAAGESNGFSKYVLLLEDLVEWSVYATGPPLRLVDPHTLAAETVVPQATVQLCKGNDPVYDRCAGVFPTECHVHATVAGSSCTYWMEYTANGSPLVWVLPHHWEAADDSTRGAATPLVLDSTTKGPMQLVVTTTVRMVEQLPLFLSSAPPRSQYSPEVLQAIRAAVEREAADDVVAAATLDSMYTSGKILSKYALVLYTLHLVVQDPQLTQQLLAKLKQAIEVFAHNKQPFPLVYDTTWKGVVLLADPGADFGNACYNDHHFHYGYHIHAAAVVAQVDQELGGTWRDSVKPWVDMLVRDVASPRRDAHFPEQRSFCWFHGHSFAHGIFASGDGKDEELSSEDVHCAYGLMLWARASGDRAGEARAALMLAVLQRALSKYMLFGRDNTVQPPQVVGNRVSGILFENKIDYATYFGRGSVGDEWIHGIHMLPTTPALVWVRGERFVREEWEDKCAAWVDRIDDGWRGILMLNYAAVDPVGVYRWFSQPGFPARWLDNGMSLSWSLAMSGGQ